MNFKDQLQVLLYIKKVNTHVADNYILDNMDFNWPILLIYNIIKSIITLLNLKYISFELIITKQQFK